MTHEKRNAAANPRFSKTPASIESEAPQFGQHTEEVLMELGDYTWDEMELLKQENII